MAQLGSNSAADQSITNSCVFVLLLKQLSSQPLPIEVWTVLHMTMGSKPVRLPVTLQPVPGLVFLCCR